jgi:hypothetical protein
MHLRVEGPRLIMSLRAVAELAVSQRTSGQAQEVWGGCLGPRLSSIINVHCFSHAIFPPTIPSCHTPATLRKSSALIHFNFLLLTHFLESNRCGRRGTSQDR